MASALDPPATAGRHRLTTLLGSIALTVCAAAGAYAQVNALPPAAGQTANGEANGAAATAAPVGGLGQTLRGSGFSLSASGRLAETYATNPLGLPGGFSGFGGYNAGSEFYTALGLNVAVHDHTLKFNGDLDYSLIGNIYSRHSNYNHVYNYLTALGIAELIPEQLFFRASAFAAPLLVNGAGPLYATANNSGLFNTFGYTVSPELRLRIGSFAVSDTSATQSSVYFGSPGGVTIPVTIPGASPVPSSYLSYGVTQHFLSGSDFYRLNWGLMGQANWFEYGLVNYELQNAIVNLRYAVQRGIVVSGDFGYQWITINQSIRRSFSGATAMGGLQLNPSPYFQANVRAGTQYGQTSYVGDFNYQLGAFTSLNGAYTDTVSSPAARLFGSLSNLGVTGGGAFYNTSYQVNPTTIPSAVSGANAFNPVPADGASFTSDLFRYRSGTVSLLHIADRTQYRLTGFYTTYDSATVLSAANPRGYIKGASMTASRSLTPRLSSAITFNYGNSNEFGGHYKTYSGLFNLNYSLNATTQTYFSATYIHRDTDTSYAGVSPLSGSLSAASISIGITKQFL